MILKATDGKVVVKLDDKESERDGLFIPDDARAKVQKGIIEGVSETAPPYLRKGVVVYLPPIAGIIITFEGTDYTVVKEYEIYTYEG